ACWRRGLQDCIDGTHLRRGCRARQQCHRSVHPPAAFQAGPRWHAQANRNPARTRLPPGSGQRRVMNSLRARLLAATGVLLLAFIILVGFALETAVSKRMYQAQRDRLQGLTYALLGNAEITASGMFNIPTGVLPEADLARPGSCLYALTLDGEGNTIWRSPSMYGTIQLEQPPAVGAWQFTRATGPSNNTLLVLAFGFR